MNATHRPDNEPAADAGLDELARRAGERLRASVDALDGHTRSRLTQARHVALAQAAQAGQGGLLARWLPAGALAASVLLVALLVLRVPGGAGAGHPLPVAGNLDDAELLADSDTLALVQESTLSADADGAELPDAQGGFDFYAWAVDADAQDAGGTEGS